MLKASLASVAVLLSFVVHSPVSSAQTSRPSLITGPIDANDLVILPASRHALAQPGFEAGAVDSNLKLTRVLLGLAPSQEQEERLRVLLDHQQDRSSPDYHHWLTPEEFGQRFGPAPQDLMAVRAWLERQGIEVTSVAKSGRWMELSA